MATKESIEPCSPKEVGQLNISLVPHAKTIYKEFVFKTPRKFALDALHKRSPIMVNDLFESNLSFIMCFPSVLRKFLIPKNRRFQDIHNFLYQSHSKIS